MCSSNPCMGILYLTFSAVTEVCVAPALWLVSPKYYFNSALGYLSPVCLTACLGMCPHALFLHISLDICCLCGCVHRLIFTSSMRPTLASFSQKVKLAGNVASTCCVLVGRSIISQKRKISFV